MNQNIIALKCSLVSSSLKKQIGKAYPTAEPKDYAMTIIDTAITRSLGPNHVAANFVQTYNDTYAVIEGKIYPMRVK